MNKVGIFGTLATSAKEEAKGVYSAYVDVPRLSGNVDRLEIVMHECAIDHDLKPEQFEAGETVIVYGELKTYREKTGHVRLFIFPGYITIGKAADQNDICLNGWLVKEPVYRERPSGRRITGLLVRVKCDLAATEAEYERPGNSLIPVICWGNNALYAKTFKFGQKIRIKGRLQSREYNNKYGQRTTYEVSASEVEKEGDNDVC